MSTDGTTRPGEDPLAAGGHAPTAAPGAGAGPAGAAGLDGDLHGDADLDGGLDGLDGPAGDADLDDPDLDGDGGTDELAAPPVSGARRALGLLLAVALAVVGAVAWAELTARTERRFALLAVAIGILIGIVVRRVARLGRLTGGLVAGLLAVLSAAGGQLAERYWLAAEFKQQVLPDWSVRDSWDEMGLAGGWEEFVANLDVLAGATLLLAGAAAFIYAADSGTRKRKPDEDGAAEPPAPELAAYTADEAPPFDAAPPVEPAAPVAGPVAPPAAGAGEGQPGEPGRPPADRDPYDGLR